MGNFISDKVKELLSDIKARPAVYLGKKSLTRLEHFLHGVAFALGENSFSLTPEGFSDYVAWYYKDRSTRNEFDIVFFHEAGDSEAFDKYFELLDAFLAGKDCEPLNEKEFKDLLSEQKDGIHQITEGSSLAALAKSYAETFNASPWNDVWTDMVAYDRLDDIFMTPHFDGFEYLKDGEAAAAVMGAGEQYFDGPVFRITELWTSPKFRRKGFASALMRELLAHLKKRGYKRVYLLTMRDESTLGFYQSLGFDVDEKMCMTGITL